MAPTPPAGRQVPLLQLLLLQTVLARAASFEAAGGPARGHLARAEAAGGQGQGQGQGQLRAAHLAVEGAAGSRGSDVRSQEQGLSDWLVSHADVRQQLPSEDYLRRNSEFALRARREIPAAAVVPEDMFLRQVLPYRQLDEPVDDWRASFFEVLAPHAAAATTLREVVEAVYPRIWTDLRSSRKVLAQPNSTAVSFKSNCTPQVMAPIRETLKVGYASCTGCSILVADALRAVGVPARVVGTPSWNTPDGGNHNWVEAWTGEHGWEFFDAAPANKVQWNQAWFVPDNTQKAVKGTINGIYAPVWDPQSADATYPYTWRDPAVQWPAEDRTDFYKGLPR